MPLRYAYEGIIVSQATENEFETCRRKIQNDIDPLKNRNDLRMAGDESMGLTQAESARLDTLKEALTRLMASEAESPKAALALCRKISHAGRQGTIEQVRAIPPYPDDRIHQNHPDR